MKKDFHLQGPRLEKYEAILQQNPGSKIFAFIADAYRQLGLYEKAFKVLQKGTRYHPSYFPGYLVLGQCYYDKEYYDSALLAVRPFIDTQKDNLTFLNLLSKLYIKLEMHESALEVCQSILFFDPKNQDVQKKIQDLKGPQEEVSLSKTLFNIEKISGHPDPKEQNVNQWKQIDFGHRGENHLLSSINTQEYLTRFLYNIQKRFQITPLHSQK